MRRIAGFMLLLSPACFGYVRQNVSGTTPAVSLVRVDNAAIQFYLNNQVGPGATSSASGKTVTVIRSDSNPQQALRAALATWNGVRTANINFLPLKLTSAVINPNDFQATIAIGSTPSDVSFVGGALAVTVDSYVPSPANRDASGTGLVGCNSNCTYPAGGIFDSDIIVNPGDTFTTTGTPGLNDLQAVLTHELGHSLSANHTSLLGGTMYPYLYGIISRYLSTDDLTFVNTAYPSATTPAPLGTMSGTITATGGAAISYGMLTMIDTTGGSTIGALTNPDGTFSIQVPPGSYIVYAEPYNPFMQPGNFYLTAAQAATVSTFQSTMYGGAASPTPVIVSPNGTATVNISVTAGTTLLKFLYYGFGGAGKSSDINNVSSIAGPVSVPSGASVDFAFIGNGLDATLTDANFRIYGQGISVRAGSVRVDKTVNFPQGPLVRATLDIPARQTSTLASIFISTSTGTLSLSAFLTVTPPTPTFISKGVISAASYLGSANGDGAVSAGDYVVLYGSGTGPTGGPYFGGFLNAGYDAGGFLPTSLAGVTVTFDGIPAPLFYVAGLVTGASQGQINLQVPFEVAGKTSTQVVVNFLGSVSAAVAVPVLPSHPAFFTTGPTTAYIGNQNPDATGNYTNTAAAPAARGDYITAYGTGVGIMPYPMQTGVGAPAPPSSVLNVATGLYFPNGFTCSIDGINTPVLFAGWTPTTVALAQWNIQVPLAIPVAGAKAIVCSNSVGSMQANLTVFVK